MELTNGNLYLNTSTTGAKINTLQKKSAHFLFPQQMMEKDDGTLTMRGGMHICSPIFGSPEGKGRFSKAPQHGELRNYHWRGAPTSRLSPESICYTTLYKKWGTNLSYSLSYFLVDDKLTVYTDIRTHVGRQDHLELGFHPYFNAPNGGSIQFVNSDVSNIHIHRAFGPQIFPACKYVVIDLHGIGKVTMELEDGFDSGFICVWTDWLGGYFCVEPLISYKEYSEGEIIVPGKNILTKFSMRFGASRLTSEEQFDSECEEGLHK